MTATLWSAALLAAGVLYLLARVLVKLDDWWSKRSYRRWRQSIERKETAG
jgi:hypothetical protein